MRAWVDLTSLRSTTVKETSVRCKIHQVDAVEETPKPNLEKAYIKSSSFLISSFLAPKPVLRDIISFDDTLHLIEH